MPFAKYQNAHSALYFTGNVLRHNGRVIANPTENHLREAGYLPVTEIGEPETEDGKICLPCYERREKDLLLTYTQVKKEDVV